MIFGEKAAALKADRSIGVRQLAYDRPLPKINARVIGWSLRRVREILELGYEEAVDGFGRDAQWLAAVETGFGGIGPGEVAALLAHYGEVPDRIRSALTGAACPSGRSAVAAVSSWPTVGNVAGHPHLRGGG
ncbi:hypothetical protein [Actinomadura fulvescens]|uniref:Uncharacterized protein n=1 Tax=Actinomadura fulvescens TaxID=46160 RepID=A0ABN3QZJ5_9ACTN